MSKIIGSISVGLSGQDAVKGIVKSDNISSIEQANNYLQFAAAGAGLSALISTNIGAHFCCDDV